MIPRVLLSQKCKQDETQKVFYFTDAHSTTIFSWLEGSAYETSACNSVHALTLNAVVQLCNFAAQLSYSTLTEGRKLSDYYKAFGPLGWTKCFVK